MVFSSILFLLFFLPLVLLLYFLTPNKHRNIILLLSSICFYAWGGPKFIIILLSTTLIDYYLVKAIYQAKKIRRKRFFLTISLIITIGLLAYFKYANFFIDNVNSTLLALGIERIRWTQIALPIGISFFSFQKLTYAVDVYRKVHDPFKKPQDYLLYIIMFPQLIAGPIIRFNEIADQIEQRNHKIDDVFQGSVRFIIGLAKKVLIANVLSSYADPVFDGNIALISSSEAWLALLAYTFQIYFDFSGYSDMAIGLGRIFGMKFPENFNNPYISRSITEFWRRWHITLGNWMRDYLYIPLGGNRVKRKSRLYFNLIFVFFISGLWHGASWNFVIWGLVHGLFLILDRLFLLRLLQKSGKVFSILFTFIITILAWVLFRIEDSESILLFYSKMFEFHFAPINLQLHLDVIGILITAVFFSIITVTRSGLKLEKIIFYTEYKGWIKYAVFFVSAILLILCIGSITASGFNPFIYFRF